MDHEEIKRKLSQYLDNTLPADQKETVKHHLGICGPCRSSLADMEWAVEQIRLLPPADPPPWLIPQILSGIGDADRSSRKKRIPSVLLALLLLILLTISIMAFRYFSPIRPAGLEQAGPAPAPAKAPPAPAPSPVFPGGRDAVPRRPRPTAPLPALPPPEPRPHQQGPSAPAPGGTSGPETLPTPHVNQGPELQPDDWVVPTGREK